MASDWRYWTATFFVTFFVAGFMEELLKYAAVALARRRSGHGSDEQPPSYIPVVIAAALGFSTVEGIGFVYVDTVRYAAGEMRLDQLALTLAERRVIVMATLIEVNMALYTRKQSSDSWKRKFPSNFCTSSLPWAL